MVFESQIDDFSSFATSLSNRRVPSKVYSECEVEQQSLKRQHSIITRGLYCISVFDRKQALLCFILEKLLPISRFCLILRECQAFLLLVGREIMLLVLRQFMVRMFSLFLYRLCVHVLYVPFVGRIFQVNLCTYCIVQQT